MGYRILYHQEVIRDDIPALPDTMLVRIKQAIEDRLCTYPDRYGKPLRKGLSGFRKLRIGDWRIVYEVDCATVIILIIAHRSKVYQDVFQRLEA